jgi:ABC-type methionine transport system ATPase subunit
MLLDEVTSALDPVLVAEVLDAIRELALEGMTMVIATHEMGFARDVASRVAFLHEGRILEEGTADQIFSAPEQEETRRFLDRIIAAGRMCGASGTGPPRTRTAVGTAPTSLANVRRCRVPSPRRHRSR